MALNTQLANATRSAATDAVCALADGGKLQLYSGTQPAAGGAVTSQTKLVEWTLPDPAFAAATNGVATANAITAVSPLAGGTATWYRVVDSSNAILWDGSVGTSSANLIIGNTTIQTGVSQSVTSFTYTTVANASGL